MKYAVNAFLGNGWLELRFHGKQSTNSQGILDPNCDFMKNSQRIPRAYLTRIVIS